jgi:hypothetical protein
MRISVNRRVSIRFDLKRVFSELLEAVIVKYADQRSSAVGIGLNRGAPLLGIEGMLRLQTDGGFSINRLARGRRQNQASTDLCQVDIVFESENRSHERLLFSDMDNIAEIPAKCRNVPSDTLRFRL